MNYSFKENGSYSEERMRWWLSRSALPQHQKVYDEVASLVDSGNGSVVDCCCGGGELLRRLCKRNSLVLGIDNTVEMLEVAARNLERLGVGYMVTRNPEDISVMGGLVLCLDDFTNSGLPEDFFDTSVLTFPDLYSGEDILLAESKKMKTVDWLSRLTRPGGRIVLIDYSGVADESSPQYEQVIDIERISASLAGLDLDSVRLIRNSEVAGDIEDHWQRDSTNLGYGIFVYRKR